MKTVILASGSSIRSDLLRRIQLRFEVKPARIDEASLRHAMEAESAPPRDIVDMLAEQKALKVSAKLPEAFVIGCDQVLVHQGKILSKPEDAEAAKVQLQSLAGEKHHLLSACVVAQDARPEWRIITRADLHMKPLSPTFIDAYVARNWPGIGDSVGSYKLEEEGARLFQRITGDYFTILGLPLLELCSYLEQRGVLQDE